MIGESGIPAWLRIASIVSGWFRLPRRCSRQSGILVVLPGGLGDALLFSGALRALRRNYPAESVVVVCDKTAAPLLSDNGLADHVIPLGGAGTTLMSRAGRVVDAMRVLRRRYTMVLHPAFSTSAPAHQICALADGSRKVWFEGEASDPGEILQDDPRGIYTRLVRVEKSAHELDKAVSFLNAIGAADVRSRDDIRPEIRLTPQDRNRARELTAVAMQQDPHALLVAVCAGARFKQKDWGMEKFTDLISQLAGRRPIVAFLLGDDSDRGRWLQGAEGVRQTQNDKGKEPCPVSVQSRPKTQGPGGQQSRVRNLAGELTARESVALIAECGLCIGNDTFGPHAAIAVGTPSVTITGGGDFPRWTPWGDPKRHRMAHSPMDCYGCGWKCVHPIRRCIATIQVGDVLREIDAVLDIDPVTCCQ